MTIKLMPNRIQTDQPSLYRQIITIERSQCYTVHSYSILLFFISFKMVKFIVSDLLFKRKNHMTVYFT